MCTTPIAIMIFIKHKLMFIIYNIEGKNFFFPMETVTDVGSNVYSIFWRIMGSHKAKKIFKENKILKKYFWCGIS